MTPNIPVREDPLPDGFWDWSKEDQEQFIQDMSMEDITKLIAYHTEENMGMFQDGPNEKQLKQLIRQWLSVGEINNGT